jgi:hypothetical protein
MSCRALGDTANSQNVRRDWSGSLINAINVISPRSPKLRPNIQHCLLQHSTFASNRSPTTKLTNAFNYHPPRCYAQPFASSDSSPLQSSARRHKMSAPEIIAHHIVSSPAATESTAVEPGSHIAVSNNCAPHNVHPNRADAKRRCTKMPEHVRTIIY